MDAATQLFYQKYCQYMEALTEDANDLIASIPRQYHDLYHPRKMDIQEFQLAWSTISSDQDLSRLWIERLSEGGFLRDREAIMRQMDQLASRPLTKARVA